MMDEYFAVPISPSNKRAMAQMDALLARVTVVFAILFAVITIVIARMTN